MTWMFIRLDICPWFVLHFDKLIVATMASRHFKNNNWRLIDYIFSQKKKFFFFLSLLYYFEVISRKFKLIQLLKSFQGLVMRNFFFAWEGLNYVKMNDIFFAVYSLIQKKILHRYIFHWYDLTFPVIVDIFK